MTPDIEQRLAALEREVRDHRRRAKTVRVGALSIAALVLAVSGVRAFADPSSPQPCDGRFSSLLYCFGADTPARASEVNSNFNALAALVDAKVGSANATPAGPNSGGTVVIGDGAANLGFDGDDIYARVNGAPGTLFLQRTGAGAVAVGGAGPNPNAKLQVNGTLSATRVETNELQVGSGGTVVRKVVTGTIGNCAVANSAGSGAIIQYGTTFTTTPIVFATPEEPDASGCTSVRIRSRTTSAFEFQAWTGGSLTACDCIHWIAIGQ